MEDGFLGLAYVERHFYMASARTLMSVKHTYILSMMWWVNFDSRMRKFFIQHQSIDNYIINFMNYIY